MMDTRTIRTLMEINTLQSLGAVQTYTEQNSTFPIHFNTMLEEMLGSSSVTDSLSSVSSTLLEISINTESLRYDGKNRVFEPSSLAALLSASQQNSAVPLNNTSLVMDNIAILLSQAAEKYNLPEN